MDYMAELFDAATIQAIGDSMQRMLEGAAAAAATNIYKLPILGQANKAQLAKLTSGDIRPHYVLDGGAALTVERFERVAAADPNRPCLKLNGAVLSYGEVNARANRLAHWLAGAGVGRDIAVGVMLDRSFELVIAMLAAMKVRAALAGLLLLFRPLFLLLPWGAAFCVPSKPVAFLVPQRRQCVAPLPDETIA
jgi:non-ribosomal peptide synthetase component F